MTFECVTICRDFYLLFEKKKTIFKQINDRPRDIRIHSNEHEHMNKYDKLVPASKFPVSTQKKPVYFN